MKIYKRSISKFILLALEKTIDGYVRLDDFINNPRRYAFGGPSYIKKSSLAQALRRLRQEGLIKQDFLKKDEVIFKLTNLGRESLGPTFDESNWDGKWRIVIFDIPEKFKTVRNLFRRRLKDWEFKIYQRSVWITKRNITSKLNDLIKDLKIDNWVAVIESDDQTIYNLMNDRLRE